MEPGYKGGINQAVNDNETFYYIAEPASWQDGESFVLIGYPSGQDEPIFPARDCPLSNYGSRKSEIFWSNLLAI